MAVNIHITIIELNALHTKRQNLFQELDAVIHLLMEAKHWGLRKRSEERFSRNAETDLVCRLLLEKKNNIEMPTKAAKKITPVTTKLVIWIHPRSPFASSLML